MSCLVLLSAALLAVTAPTPPAKVNPDPLPNGINKEQWPDDFNPQTQQERVDTDSTTDEDVIIMEEDEDSENLPGNTENPSQ